MGFSKQECWSGLPCPSPGDLPDPGIEPRSPALEADSLPLAPPGKPTYFIHSISGIYICQSQSPNSFHPPSICFKYSFIHSFIHLFNKYFLNIYYAWDTEINIENKELLETPILDLMHLQFSELCVYSVFTEFLLYEGSYCRCGKTENTKKRYHIGVYLKAFEVWVSV